MGTSKYADSAAVDEALDRAMTSAKEINGQGLISYFLEIADTNEFPVHVVGIGQRKITLAYIKSHLAANYIPNIATLSEESDIATDDEFTFRDKSVTTLGAQIHKKITWANIRAALKTYFDTLYTVPVGTISGILKGDGEGGISEATAGTDYAVPISVVPSESTTPTIATAATGTIYTFSNALTSLAITTNPTAPFWYRIDFTAGGSFTPTYAATPDWNGGTAPTITNGKKYSLIITDHISSFAEA